MARKVSGPHMLRTRRGVAKLYQYLHERRKRSMSPKSRCCRMTICISAGRVIKLLGSSGVAGRVAETFDASVLFRMVLHLRNFSRPGVDGADSKSHSLRAGDRGSVMKVMVLRIPLATRAGDIRWKGPTSEAFGCVPALRSILEAKLAEANRMDDFA